MGYICHHAVLVTSSYGDEIDRLHSWALTHAAFTDFPAQCISPISPAGINGQRSFAVFPDGSKEGWEDSDNGDGFRDAVIAKAEEVRYEDGSSPIDWCHVQFGDERGDTRILCDSDYTRRNKFASR